MFWDNVEAILTKENKLSHGWKKELARQTSIPYRTLVNQYENKSDPKAKDASKIAQVLMTTVEELSLGRKPHSPTLTNVQTQENQKIIEQAEKLAKKAEELKQLVQGANLPAGANLEEARPPTPAAKPPPQPSKQEKLKQVAEHLHMSTLADMQNNTAKTHDTHEASDTEKLALKLQSLAHAEKANTPIVNDDWYLQENEILAIPDCDTIAAGEPMTPLPELGNTYLVPMSQMPQPFNPKEYGIFRIRGNSMIDMDIKHGERVLIKWTTAPKHNTVMLVYRENHDGCTLKLLKQTGTEWRMYWCNGTDEYRIMQHGDRVVGEYIKVVELWRRK